MKDNGLEIPKALAMPKATELPSGWIQIDGLYFDAEFVRGIGPGPRLGTVGVIIDGVANLVSGTPVEVAERVFAAQKAVRS